MNNLKKVGLSALAGSLVAFSANAVEMTVSGTAEVTYTTNGGAAGGSTGDAWGSNTSLGFNGTGDVGFGTATIQRTINDGLGSTFLSAWQTVDMGDMGTISFDSVGGGLEGTVAYDDTIPTAYEEVWNGVSSSGVSGAASNDTIGYSNSFGGVGISLARSSKGTTGGTGDGGNGGTKTGSITDMVVTMAVPGVDGLSLTAGSSTTDYTAAASNDDTTTFGTLVYSAGNVSVGYQMVENQSGTAGANGKNTERYSVAFNVNDELSVSIAGQDMEYDAPSSTNTTEEVTAFNASYTSGAASVRTTFSESDNDGGTAGSKEEHMEISLVLSF